MKKSDLFREWARVLDMCEGAQANPNKCWKFKGDIVDSKPEFIQNPESYEFAIAILEGKPVFVGDKLYFPNGTPLIIECNELRETMSVLSWKEPKKTFMLNGVELPCPEDYTSDNNSILLLRACFDGINQTARFEFSNNNAKKVLDVLATLLMENTK